MADTCAHCGEELSGKCIEVAELDSPDAASATVLEMYHPDCWDMADWLRGFATAEIEKDRPRRRRPHADE